MKFSYTTTDRQGKTAQGVLEATSLHDAVLQLRGRGVLITQLSPLTDNVAFFARFRAHLGHISLLQRALLARHLALMLRAGIPIDRSFEILLRQAKQKALHATLEEVLVAIRRGETLADALAKYPRIFSERFIAMVRWGEAGGTLPESLDNLATQLERDRDLQSKVRGAMIYPLVIVMVIVTVGILMAIFVIPQLVSVLTSFNAQLPLMTRIFIGLSQFLISYGLVVLPACAMGVVALIFLFRLPSFRPFFHRFLLHVPLLGNVAKMVNVARLNRALGSLQQSGMPMLEALTLTERLLGNRVYQKAVEDALVHVKKGEPLGKTLSQYPALFSPIESDMVAIGEETGRLPEVLSYLADYYEEQVSQITKNLSQVIEPFLLVLVGLAVAGLALAVIAPIYQLSEAIV